MSRFRRRLLRSTRGFEPAFDSPIDGVRATVILDFTGKQYLFDGNNRATIAEALADSTRASTKLYRNSSGLYTTAAVDEFQVHHTSGGVALGLQIEPLRSNVLDFSEDLSNGAWDTVSNMTQAKDVTGADGVSNSANRLTATDASAVITQAYSGLTDAVRLFSAHIKRITGNGTIEITVDGSAWENITSEINASTFEQVETPVAASSTSGVCGFRITTSGDVIAVQYSQLEKPLDVSTTVTYPGATSPMPTSDATLVSRAVDNVKLDAGVDLPFPGFNLAAGTFVVRWGFLTNTENGSVFALHQIGDEGNDRFNFNTTGANKAQWFSKVSGATQWSETSVADTNDDYVSNTAAMCYAANDARFSLNGATTLTDPGVTLPAAGVLDEMFLGFLASPARVSKIIIEQLRYYDSALSSADLEAF